MISDIPSHRCSEPQESWVFKQRLNRTSVDECGQSFTAKNAYDFIIELVYSYTHDATSAKRCHLVP